MIVLVALAGAACAFGLATWAALRRWPLLDPGAPGGAVHAIGQEARDELDPSFLRRRLDPATSAGLALTVGVVVAMVGGVLLAVLAFAVRSNGFLRGIDRGLATWGATHATEFSTRILRDVTQFGSTIFIIGIAVVVALVSVRRPRPGSVVAYLAVVVAGQNLIANLIKLAVDRVRPDIRPLAGFSGASFPSGHTTAAFATFAACAVVLGRGRGGRVHALLLGVAIGLATAVGGSHALLGVHWLTDVIGGAALGLAWFSLVTIAFGGRLMRFGAPIEVAQRAANLEEVEASTDRERSPRRP